MMKSINQRLKELEEMNELLKEKQKVEAAPKRSFMDILTGKKKVQKEWKLPKKVTMGSKKKEKQNYAVVFYIRTNGCIDIYYAPIVNDMIYVKESGIYHAANAEYIMRYNKFPSLIIPEWTLEPFSPKENVKETLEEGKVSFPQKVIINAMKMAQLGAPKTMGNKTIFIMVILGIVALYIISQIISGGS